MIVVGWLAAALAGVALVITLINLATWPRGRRVASAVGRVSVLVPARDEERSIGACVDAVLGAGHPVHELIVLDDGSTDQTGPILEERAAGDRRLRVLSGAGLPSGWVGKPHACHQLGTAATGELLLFVDADVELAPDALARLAGLFEDYDADVVTAVPRQLTGSFVERLILPLLHVTYTAWLPLALVHSTRNPRFLAANGQIIAFRREAWEAIGGFEAVRNEVVDDMAICRRAKQLGLRVVFADGALLASCRMYHSAREVWQGFSKNLYEGVGERPIALLGVIAAYLLAFVVPFVLLGLAPLVPELWVPALVGVAVNVALRVSLAVRYAHPVVGVLLHPLAVLGLVAIAVNSWRWSRRGAIEWAGRTYEPRRIR